MLTAGVEVTSRSTTKKFDTTMIAASFRARRRQKFLTKKYFNLNLQAWNFLMRESAKDFVESNKATTNSSAPKKPRKCVMQMSHKWIQQRVRGHLGKPSLESDILFFGVGKIQNYSRHVILSSLPQYIEHYEAIEQAAATKSPIDESRHRNHVITMEFGDAQISAAESKRVSSNGTP